MTELAEVAVVEKEVSAMAVVDHDEKKTEEEELARDCNDSMLESMDHCVGCVEGVEMQQNFEENLAQYQLIELPVPEASATPLTHDEAAWIRGQVDNQKVSTKCPPELDLLNICGRDEEAPGVVESPVKETEKSMDSETSVLSATEDSTEPKCCVCSSTEERVNLPCCEGSFMCSGCVLVLTYSTSKSRVGRCPCCRAWFELSRKDEEGVVASLITTSGKCEICCRDQDLLVDGGCVCDACFLGRQQPLLYECEQCHSVQRVPHPMYRYQAKENQFGTVTWACQGECGKFTHWRMCIDQKRWIPIGDIPETWGENDMSIARARVQEARKGLVVKEQGSGCTIL